MNKITLTPEQQRIRQLHDAGIKDIDADFASANQMYQAAIRDGDDATAFSAFEAMNYQQERRAKADRAAKQALQETFARQAQQQQNRLSEDERAVAKSMNMTEDEWIKAREEVKKSGKGQQFGIGMR